MTTPRVHAKVIKAWADGAQIQFLNAGTSTWHDVAPPFCWYDSVKYRVKPTQTTRYLWCVNSDGKQWRLSCIYMTPEEAREHFSCHPHQPVPGSGMTFEE